MGSISTIFGRIQDIMQGGSFQVRYIQPTDNMVVSAASLPVNATDRRTLSKTFKLMDEVVKCCMNSRLSLKNSPPFILDILPDTYTLLMTIFTNNHTALRDNYYLQVFIENMQNKCKQVLKLFKTNAIYNEVTAERRAFTKLCLVFSHMLFELKAEFPDGMYIADKFRITKREAEDFWMKSFPNRLCVPWGEFLSALLKGHGDRSMTRIEQNALKDTIDLTGNDHVSNFEFDVFTRLFYPWKTLIGNWQLLTASHPGYVAFLTYDEVRKMLEKLVSMPGSYVFRLSVTRPGQWAIGYVAPDKKIYQTIPQNKSLIQALHEGGKEGFYLYPNGRQKDIDLSGQMEIPPADRVKVTSEQYDLYCEMGTTFEMCKICDDNEKNIKIEPCGHLLCTPCLTSWQISRNFATFTGFAQRSLKESENGNTCPFCRYEIKGTNKVIIDRFRPDKKSIKIRNESKNIEKAATVENSRVSLIDFKDCAVEVPRSPTCTLEEYQNLLADVPQEAAPPVPPRPPKRNTSTKRSSTQVLPDPSYVNVSHLEPPVEPAPNYVNAAILSSRQS